LTTVSLGLSILGLSSFVLGIGHEVTRWEFP
jgi:hypothetical protein